MIYRIGAAITAPINVNTKNIRHTTSTWVYKALGKANNPHLALDYHLLVSRLCVRGG